MHSYFSLPTSSSLRPLAIDHVVTRLRGCSTGCSCHLHAIPCDWWGPCCPASPRHGEHRASYSLELRNLYTPPPLPPYHRLRSPVRLSPEPLLGGGGAGGLYMNSSVAFIIPHPLISSENAGTSATRHGANTALRQWDVRGPGAHCLNVLRTNEGVRARGGQHRGPP